MASAEQAIAGGHSRVGLVSAAVSDHTQIDELATELEGMGASISASSMRMDPISLPLIRAMARDGARNLTVAPEAGSQRLRNVINKTQTEEQMMEAISLAQEFDFPQLKLYFMVGHPTETDDDIQALIDFTLQARERFRRRIAINATPFVPKAHTPFQWEGMVDSAVLRQRQKSIHRALVATWRGDSRGFTGSGGGAGCAQPRRQTVGRRLAGDSIRRPKCEALLRDDGGAGAGQG